MGDSYVDFVSQLTRWHELAGMPGCYQSDTWRGPGHAVRPRGDELRNPLRGLTDTLDRLSRASSGSAAQIEKLEAEVAALRQAITEIRDYNYAIGQDAVRYHAGTSELLIDQIVLSDPRYRDPRCLNACRGQVYSQANEDGILAEIFERIGTDNRAFVEIAAGDGIENTTRLLLDLGWSGIWVEGGPEEAASARKAGETAIADGRLAFLEAKVDKDNVAALLEPHIEGSPDLLSLDIDYNTSHVWKALGHLTPRVVCVEYNGHFPPSVDHEVSYDPAGIWRGTTRFGASLKALERIGRELGYCLVGCDLFGVNAFFVRRDLCDEERFLAPFTAATHYEPPRYSAIHMRGHRRHGAD